MFNSWIDRKEHYIKWVIIQNQIVSRNKIKVELDLSNYAMEIGRKKATGVKTSKFTNKFDLVNLKSKVDKLDIDKLKTGLIDIIKLNDVVDNDIVKKTIYYKLITKVSAVDPMN